MKLAVIGRDVSRSDSPAMHSFIARSLGDEITYEALSLPEEQFEERIGGILSAYDGFNVTIPYKLRVIPHLKKLCGDAALFGAVNTVLCSDLSGHNTDGFGFMLMLSANGVETECRRALILGAGGAGRAAAQKLCRAGAEVFVYDRNPANSQSLAKDCPGAVPSPRPFAGCDILINATGVGMHQTVGVSPVGQDIISGAAVAVDLIYEPAESAFLRMARELGKRTVNGLSMLFYQAYCAECIYFGRRPRENTATELYKDYLKYIKEAKS